jgi:hypothetical protein
MANNDQRITYYGLPSNIYSLQFVLVLGPESFGSRLAGLVKLVTSLDVGRSLGLTAQNEHLASLPKSYLFFTLYPFIVARSSPRQRTIYYLLPTIYYHLPLPFILNPLFAQDFTFQRYHD